MIKTVTIIDPFYSGHHIYYAKLLAGALKKVNVKVFAVGNKALVSVLDKHGLIHDAVELTCNSSRGISGEYARTKFIFESIKLSKAINADITHYLYIDRFILGLFANQMIENLRLKLRATLHWAYFIPEFSTNRMRAFFELQALKHLLRNDLRIMAHSQELVNMLNNRTNSASFDYVPYPVDCSTITTQERLKQRADVRTRYNIPETCTLLLAFGGTRFDKGVDLAIEALGKLPPDYHLLIAGTEELFSKEQLLLKAKRHGVAPRLHMFLSYVPEDELESYFAAADMLVLPYRKTFAGQSGPLATAASLGLPIVSSDAMVLRESVVKYNLGITFPAEDIVKLATAILDLKSNPVTPQKNKFCLEHSDDTFANYILASYKETSIVKVVT